MSTYYLLNYIGAASLFLYNFLCIKKRRELTMSRFRRKISKKITQWLIIETVLISCFQYAPILFLNKAVGVLFGTGANYFGLLYLSPVFLGIGCAVLGTDWMNQIDLVTPAYPLALFFSKIGCFFAGCCKGVVWEHGIANARTGIKEFPLQLVEAAVALVIFGLFIVYKKKLKPGTAFPVYILLYSSSRFFTEFFSGEPLFFMGLRKYQFLCLVGLAVGMMEYYVAITDQRNLGE